jgi:hypothetical protein
MRQPGRAIAELSAHGQWKIRFPWETAAGRSKTMPRRARLTIKEALGIDRKGGRRWSGFSR